jgi:hypothetical protein
MNVPTVIFLIFCAFLLGVAIGGYVATLRQGKKPEGADGDSQANDLISLHKDPASGVLEVVMSGKTYKTVSEMSTVQRTLAGYAASDLRSWLNPQAPTEQNSAGDAPLTAVSPLAGVIAAMTSAVELPAAEKGTKASPAQPESSPPASVVDLALQDSLPGDIAEVEEPKKKKRASIIGTLTRALSSDVTTSRIAPVSIAVQVNQILQKKLKDSPLQNRGICLIELPGHEMVVMIGEDKYESVSAVPDDEIRAVLQSAVNDWLARSTT